MFSATHVGEGGVIESSNKISVVFIFGKCPVSPPLVKVYYKKLEKLNQKKTISVKFKKKNPESKGEFLVSCEGRFNT